MRAYIQIKSQVPECRVSPDIKVSLCQPPINIWMKNYSQTFSCFATNFSGAGNFLDLLTNKNKSYTHFREHAQQRRRKQKISMYPSSEMSLEGNEPTKGTDESSWGEKLSSNSRNRHIGEKGVNRESELRGDPSDPSRSLHSQPSSNPTLQDTNGMSHQVTECQRWVLRKENRKSTLAHTNSWQKASQWAFQWINLHEKGMITKIQIQTLKFYCLGILSLQCGFFNVS